MDIEGKKMSERILARLAERVRVLPTPPRLVAVLVGDDIEHGSRGFVAIKERVARQIGLEFTLHEFPAAITTEALHRELLAIADDSANTAIIVQLPLPAHINTQDILNTIPVAKDADILSQSAQGAFFAGSSSLLPPAVASVRLILEEHQIELRGKTCVVFGYGQLVGKPISHWLAIQGATVTIFNEFTPDQGLLSRQVDIIISGVGRAGLITGSMVREAAVVLDFGYNRSGDRVVGDVAYDEVAPRAQLITPVPGGLGPLVIATFLQNVITLGESTHA